MDCLLAHRRRIAILCHGLEGSSGSKYIIGTSAILEEYGWDIAAINYRGCSGVMNQQPRMYHSGATDDLHTVIEYFSDDYEEVALVGFSLGGNVVLKYCGEELYNISPKITSTVAISVPVNLKAGSINISKRSNFIYEHKFLVSLEKKIKAKHKQYPDLVDLSLLDNMKTLYDFDDRYTGPLHGFRNADDYYDRCSSQQFLHNIKVPTLIINALDDPFLPEECYPFQEVDKNPELAMLTPDHGGHVGFSSIRGKYYWNETITKDFLISRSSFC